MMRIITILIVISFAAVLAGCGGQSPQMGSGFGSDSNFGFGSSSSMAKSAPNKLASTFWNIESLKRDVKVEEIGGTSEKIGDIQIAFKEVTFEGERWQGNPTKTFAYFALPVKNGGVKLPAVIYVHDLGQTASKEIVKEWASRGYAAISIDLPGKGQSREASRSTGPDMTLDNIFKSTQSAKESWMYPAATSVIKAISVLSGSPSIDPFRIGVVGEGWGGVIALIVNGVDNRVKAASSIYGSGYLAEKSAWVERIKKMPAKERKAWSDAFDPSSYVKSQSGPVLYLTATGSTDYPLASFLKTVKSTQSDKACAIVPNSGKMDDLTLGDVHLWFDWALKNGSGLPKVISQVKANTLTVTAKGGRPAVKAILYHKPESGGKWESAEAKADKGSFSFTLPDGSGSVSYFVSVIDDQNGVVSTDVGVYRSKNVKTANNRR